MCSSSGGGITAGSMQLGVSRRPAKRAKCIEVVVIREDTLEERFGKCTHQDVYIAKLATHIAIVEVRRLILHEEFTVCPAKHAIIFKKVEELGSPSLRGD